MKNWLRNKLHNFIFPSDGLASVKNSSSIKGLSIKGIGQSYEGIDQDSHEPIRFTIYNANGGKILETRTYDKRNDRWLSSLHVIENNENFGDSIGKIIFTEMLKKG
jgi:hypothetical protein